MNALFELIVTALHDKNAGLIVAIVVIVAGGTALGTATLMFKGGVELRRFEKAMESEFDKVHMDMMKNRLELEAQNKKLQDQLDRAWTVDMQAIWGSMTAHRNTNGWVPDAWRIWEAVKAGRAPDPMQIRP